MASQGWGRVAGVGGARGLDKQAHPPSSRGCVGGGFRRAPPDAGGPRGWVLLSHQLLSGALACLPPTPRPGDRPAAFLRAACCRPGDSRPRQPGNARPRPGPAAAGFPIWKLLSRVCANHPVSSLVVCRPLGRRAGKPGDKRLFCAGDPLPGSERMGVCFLVPNSRISKCRAATFTGGQSLA